MDRVQMARIFLVCTSTGSIVADCYTSTSLLFYNLRLPLIVLLQFFVIFQLVSCEICIDSDNSQIPPGFAYAGCYMHVYPLVSLLEISFHYTNTHCRLQLFFFSFILKLEGHEKIVFFGLYTKYFIS